MKNENCNLHFTMFPSLQINKTHACIVQNYKLQVYKFASKQINININHKSYITILQFLKKSFKVLEIYNITILQIAKFKFANAHL